MVENSVSENRRLVRRLLDQVWNRGDWMVADELLAPDLIDHTPFPGQTPGREGYKRGMAQVRTAASNFRLTVEDMLAEGDRVVTRWVACGIHTGALFGIPATGQPVRVTGMTVVRIAGGQIVEQWMNWDAFGLLKQLGVINSE